MPAIILSALQLLFLAVLAPALSWFIKKMKAASQNRVGPDLVQVYSDLLKLFRKNMVISETASWVFHVMPFVLFASTLAAASMLPVLGAHSLFGIRLIRGICPPSKPGLVVLPERFSAPFLPRHDCLPCPDPIPRPRLFVFLLAPFGSVISFIFTIIIPL